MNEIPNYNLCVSSEFCNTQTFFSFIYFETSNNHEKFIGAKVCTRRENTFCGKIKLAFLLHYIHSVYNK